MNLLNKDELGRLFSSKTGKLVLLVLDENEPSSQHLAQVVQNLSQDFPEVTFKMAKYQEFPDSHLLTSLPAVLFYKDNSLVNKLEGCSTSMLVTTVRGWSKDSQEETVDKIKRLLRDHPVLLFMKGEKNDPFCRFSRAVVEMLNNSGVKFEGYNIFDDPNLREELKRYSNWPTYPQLYVKGTLVGGHDIIKELYETKTLRNEIPPEYLT